MLSIGTWRKYKLGAKWSDKKEGQLAADMMVTSVLWKYIVVRMEVEHVSQFARFSNQHAKEEDILAYLLRGIELR